MSVRPAAVADLFYPGNTNDLTSCIAAALRDASTQLPASLPAPKAVIVPHAGYIYSGPTAGFAYASLKQANIKRIVLLGPAHRVPFYGMALSGDDAFATPLGEVRLDTVTMQQVLTFPDVQINDAAHAQEHSLEVQLPFLQMVLDDFLLLPLCIGSVQPDAVASVIDSLWGDDKTLFVISSDLSHFHPYAEANTLDMRSIEAVLQLRGHLSHEQACGATGINALLLVARRLGLIPKLLDYRNSGDTAGDKDRVVGYASIAFFEPERA